MSKTELHICALNPEAHEPRPECQVGEMLSGEVLVMLVDDHVVAMDYDSEPAEPLPPNGGRINFY